MGQNQTKSYVVKIHSIPVNYRVDDEVSRTLLESCVVNVEEGKDVTFQDLVDAMKSFPGIDPTKIQFYYRNYKNYPVRNQRDLESLRAAKFFTENENFTLEYAGESPIFESESDSEDETSSQMKAKDKVAKLELVEGVISQMDAGFAELAEAVISFKDEVAAVKLTQENLAKQISELRETLKRSEPEVKSKSKATKRQKIEPPLPMD